jgi:endonuclease YncB( thermonuclease family)
MDSNYYRFSVRLANIDCPEIRTRNEIEKEYAIKVKNNLEELILNQYIDLNIIKTDKYGRLLATIYYNNKCINDWLLKNHLAVDYKGKTKVSPENWKEYYDEITFVAFEDFNHTCK